jgi:hypothetical protein
VSGEQIHHDSHSPHDEDEPEEEDEGDEESKQGVRGIPRPEKR